MDSARALLGAAGSRLVRGSWVKASLSLKITLKSFSWLTCHG